MVPMRSDAPLKIIVIRRDNIGDLVCTLPMVTALRARYPDAEISALVNSYNLDVLKGNPELDHVYAYTKAKHRPPGKSVAGVYWDRLRLFARLRRERFDYAIIAGAHFLPRALRLARMIKPKHIIGFTEPKPGAHHIDVGVPYTLPQPMHEVEDIFRLLAPLGIEGTPPAATVVADAKEVVEARALLAKQDWPAGRRLIALHISARKVSQRWPVERFVALARRLHQESGAAFLLFWSPGDSSNPLHPGDDDKAREIVTGLGGIPILAYPTHRLGELIAGLSLCEAVVCSDGGAMHIAAGLGKPILCFFGNSDRKRWHPWGVPHVLLQKESREVTDISVDEAAEGFARLLEKTKGG